MIRRSKGKLNPWIDDVESPAVRLEAEEQRHAIDAVTSARVGER